MLTNINSQTKHARICLPIKDSVVTESKVIANEKLFQLDRVKH